jgi:hypothetical protein
MERGETDVGHFLFAENEALIGQGIVRLGDIGSGHRGCRCAPRQRKTQSGGPHSRQGGGFTCAFRGRSFLDHGRYSKVVVKARDVASVRPVDPTRNGC